MSSYSIYLSTKGGDGFLLYSIFIYFDEEEKQ